MENLLRDENILLNQSISTQEEAIEKAGQLLVDSGVVKAGYVQAM
ncbi:PTS sugar transporter subunit IIA, partial [Staphylococcus aureus]|nr:PTS sugar transporter subunit IIA [Staphylococcus aureus]